MASKTLLLASAFLLSSMLALSARAQTAPALSGAVTSAEAGRMEGVVVSARAEGSTITLSVVSDAQGVYAFPAARLAPGRYKLSVRASGYELVAPQSAEVKQGAATQTDIALKRAADLSAQLSNTEWMQSIPGTAAQKKILLNCVGCHTLERIFRSTHDAAEFRQVFERMGGYYPGSMSLHPQRLPNSQRDMGRGTNLDSAAGYLASVNLSQGGRWSYELKTLPRPTGRATRVLVTEYDLPRPTIEPHDVIVDGAGTVWFSNFGEQTFGKLDPKSGNTVEYDVPTLKPGYPTGTQDLEIDPDGKLWIALMFQVGFARFDPATEKLQIYPVPADWQSPASQTGMVSPAHAVDGKVWGKNTSQKSLMKLDMRSGQWEQLRANDPTGRNLGSYGIPTDHQNNLWLLNFDGAEIGKVDAKTGALTIYQTPTAGSRPRRGAFDAQNRLWFGEFGANAIGMFDPATQRFREWVLPTEWSAPYDAAGAKNGDAWTGSMFSDRVARLDAKTDQLVEYQLPRTTNIRRVFVDEASSLWIGSNHGASIIHVEPLD